MVKFLLKILSEGEKKHRRQNRILIGPLELQLVECSLLLIACRKLGFVITVNPHRRVISQSPLWCIIISSFLDFRRSSLCMHLFLVQEIAFVSVIYGRLVKVVASRCCCWSIERLTNTRKLGGRHTHRERRGKVWIIYAFNLVSNIICN